jgi:hypothetical protein
MKLASLFAAALAVIAVPAAAQDLAAGARAAAAKALTDPTSWNFVEGITTEVGARPVGQAGMARASDWGVARLKALGFQNVHVESFTTPAWIRGAESAEVVSPFPQKLQILGLGRSSPTPPGGITAPIVLFHSYQAMLDQPAGSLAGKIAVVTQVQRRTEDGSGYGSINAMRTQGPVEAAKRGAVGYLIRSLSTADTRLPHAGSANPGGIPAAALSTPDAELLDHMVERGQAVVIHLAMASTSNPAAQSWNVVGEIPGREKPDEVIVVGGHLDSWDPGQGAIDDGAGMAIATGAAKVTGSMGQPRRTIRVVLWGSEEQGGSGEAYAAAHKGEVGKIILAGESDEGGGQVWQAALPAGSVDAPAMKAFESALPGLKVDLLRTPSRFGGSDIEGLIGLGAPTVDFSPDGTHYFDWHHTADDTLDKINPHDLAQATAVWAAFLYTVANSDIDFRALKPAGPPPPDRGR